MDTPYIYTSELDTMIFGLSMTKVSEGMPRTNVGGKDIKRDFRIV